MERLSYPCEGLLGIRCNISENLRKGKQLLRLTARQSTVRDGSLYSPGEFLWLFVYERHRYPVGREEYDDQRRACVHQLRRQER